MDTSVFAQIYPPTEDGRFQGSILDVDSQLANDKDTVSFSYCGFGTWELFIPNSNGLSSCSLDVPQKNSHLEGIPVYPKFKDNQVGYSWLYDVVYPIKIPLNANVNFNHNRMDNPHYIPIFPAQSLFFMLKPVEKSYCCLHIPSYPQSIHNISQLWMIFPWNIHDKPTSTPMCWCCFCWLGTVSRVVYPRCWNRTVARSIVGAPGGWICWYAMFRYI